MSAIPDRAYLHLEIDLSGLVYAAGYDGTSGFEVMAVFHDRQDAAAYVATHKTTTDGRSFYVMNIGYAT